MSYMENKKKLDKIRQEYSCKGEVLFRTAIQMLMECGTEQFNDASWFEIVMQNVDMRHNVAETNGKSLFMTKDFEKAIYECAKELAQIDVCNLLMYIQREIWFHNEVGELSYERAVQLCKNCLSYLEADTYETEFALEEARDIGFSDDEIEMLGFGYILDIEQEDEE